MAMELLKMERNVTVDRLKTAARKIHVVIQLHVNSLKKPNVLLVLAAIIVK